MKAILSFVAVAVVTVGLSALIGCESMHHDSDNSSSSVNHAQTSGGNGEFGETPARPGRYNSDNGTGGNTNGNTNDNR